MDSETGILKARTPSTTSSEEDGSIGSTGTLTVGTPRRLKFTKTKGFTKDTCACVVVTVVLVVLGAVAGIYFGLKYLGVAKRTDRVYKGTFKVLTGDEYHSKYSDGLSEEFRSRAHFYESRLNALFNNSGLSEAFLKTEVLALDRAGEDNVIVHFNLHTKSSSDVTTSSSDIYLALANEIVLGKYSQHFSGLSIDQESIEVIERSPKASVVKDAWGPRMQIPGLLEGRVDSRADSSNEEVRQQRPRKCRSTELKFCSNILQFNRTSYPNIMGHSDIGQIMEDLVLYRQISDSECYGHAHTFVCHLLQPQCIANKPVVPCMNFCSEFVERCFNHIPDSVKEKIKCEQFPRYTKQGSCWTKPGCVNELRDKNLHERICDGIIDCADKSDEYGCDTCKPGQFMCGDGYCVDMKNRCDNSLDCENGADESGCLSLAPSISKASSVNPSFYNEGYLIHNNGGYLGKICTDSLNNASLPSKRVDVILGSLAKTTCKLLGFQATKNIEIRKDTDDNHQAFVHMVDPLSSVVKFVKSPCPSRDVLFLRCSNLECGRKSTEKSFEDKSRGGQMDGYRSVYETDWPWHATLLHSKGYKCDATLVSGRWLIASSKCFQGMPGSEWTALFGSVRHTSQSPNHKYIPVSGIIRSPFQGQNDITLVQLKESVHYTKRIMPVCLTTKAGNYTDDNLMGPNGHCVTLAYDSEGDWLEEIYVQIVNPARCPDIIDTEHNICVEHLIPNSRQTHKCQVGSPVMCNSEGKWFLAGVNIGSACQNKPQTFNKVSPLSQWVYATISALSIN